MSFKGSGWWVLAVIAVVWAAPNKSWGTGACTSARFPDYKSLGCRVTPGTAGGPGSGADQSGGNQANCPDCPPRRGIPRWHVQEPYVNLFVTDEPLSYRLSSGDEMVFRFHYKQRYQLPREDQCPGLYTAFSAGTTRRSMDYYVNVAHTQGMTNAAWGHNWMMDIMFWDPVWERDKFGTPFQKGHEALVFRPEGAISYFYYTNTFTTNYQGMVSDPLSQVDLRTRSGLGYVTMSTGAAVDGNNINWGEAGAGFVMVYPDGSQDVFGCTYYIHGQPFVPIPPATMHQYETTARAFLTQRIDPHGRITRLGYELTPYPYNGTYRLKYVVDPDGRTNTFTYNDSVAPAPFAVSEIRDPFGRTATFTYGGNGFTNGLLTSITDAATNTSTFAYSGTSGWITNLTTPYGTTSFHHFQEADPAVTDGFSQRAMQVRKPDGSSELFWYLHNTTLIPGTATAPSVPGQVFDDGTTGGTHAALTYRNTYHWDARQFAALSSGVRYYLTNLYVTPNFNSAVAAFSTNDLCKADLKHWRLGSDGISISESLSSERAPSPDAAGLIEGPRVWYNYATNQYNYNAPEVEGNAQVTCIAQVLPDGSSQYSLYQYSTNAVAPWGARLDLSRSSYSLTNGSVGELTNRFTYASDGIDLLRITNSLNQYVNLGYNTNHQVTFVTNALGQVASAGYDATTHHLKALTNVSGLIATLSYYASNTTSPNSKMLSNVVWSPTTYSVTLTWTNGLPRIFHSSGTNLPDLWLTNVWDGLNRPIGTVFTDGTSVSNYFDALKLAGVKDRLGRWTYYGYDALEHVTSITDPLNNVTLLGWCGCGALESITDAQTNTTTYTYNNQGLLSGISFPDSSGLAYSYDSIGRLTAVTDGGSRSLTADYNNQGLLTVISNAYGPLQRILYDAVNRPFQITDEGNVTLTRQFDALNRLTNQLWPDSVAESFGWATNGLVAYTNRNQKVTRYGRDKAGRLTSVLNANSETVQLGYNALNQVTDLWDGRTNHTVWHYNPFGWLTNKLDALNREVFRYSYDANGQVITNWTPQFGNTVYTYDAAGNLRTNKTTQATVVYAYDSLNRLRTMTDLFGSTTFSNTPTGNPLSEDGPWSNDAVIYGYTEGLRTSMSVGSQSFGYSFDSAWRMSAVGSPAGTFHYGYEAARPTFLSTIMLPNQAWVTNHYDALSRLDYTALVNQWGHVLDGYSYTPDLLGLRTNITRDLGLTTNSVAVGYDDIGQIKSWSAKESGGTLRLNEQLGWAYDKAANLQYRTNGALVQTFNNDVVNELTNITRTGTLTLNGNTPAPAISVTVNGLTAQTNGDFTFAATNLTLANGANSFTNIAVNAYSVRTTNAFTVNLPSSLVLLYDSNGNLTNDGARSFAYDAENQLTNITVTNIATTASSKTDFVYDGLGRRRIARDYARNGSSWSLTNETRYLYDGYLLIQERDTNNVVRVTYTRGLDLSGSLDGAGGIGGLLARTDASGSTYYHADGVGNVTALMDEQGTMAARYLYNAFGKPLGKWGSKADANTMQFSSMPQHANSGLSLYAFRAYDPSLQRWTQRDPIGERGGINIYGLARNNPLEYVDPLGLDNFTGPNNAPPALTLSSPVGGGNLIAHYPAISGDPFFAFGFMTMGGMVAGGTFGAAMEYHGISSAIRCICQKRANNPKMGPGAMRRPIYREGSGHGPKSRPGKSRAPKNGQYALDRSVQVKPTNDRRRIGLDEDENFVVLDRDTTGSGSHPDIYHGHVRTWGELEPEMQRALINNGMATRSGNPICN